MTDNPVDPRRVEYLPIGDIVPDQRNPKAHDTDLIDSSIGRFGLLDLIVRDGRTNRIVSGHGRHKVLSAMQARGETPPEGVQVDEQGRWLVPVVTGWSSRTDTEAAAALIAMNQTTIAGDWVDEELLNLLDELEGAGEGAMIGVGISDKDVDKLRDKLDGLTVMDGQDDDDAWASAFEKVPDGPQSMFTRTFNLTGDQAEALDEAFDVAPGVKPAERLAYVCRWFAEHYAPGPAPDDFDAAAGMPDPEDGDGA